MRETNLDCCVVRDLLPSYLEELTETETSAMVREHIEHCAACRQLEEDMRRQVPIEKAPQRALRFLKRVKRTRLIAAMLAPGENRHFEPGKFSQFWPEPGTNPAQWVRLKTPFRVHPKQPN